MEDISAVGVELEAAALEYGRKDHKAGVTFCTAAWELAIRDDDDQLGSNQGRLIRGLETQKLPMEEQPPTP